MEVDIRYEKNLVVNNKELNYKGIFRSDELFSVINKALTVRGYEQREKKTEELVTESGRRTSLELRPFKAKANYIFYMIKIKILLDNVTEAREDQQKYLKGEVSISFDSWLMTDYQHRFDIKPVLYFLKGVISKYFYKFPLEEKFPSELRSDTDYIYHQISSLLKSYQKPSGKPRKKEEDIKKEVEKEISGLE
ncbi:MAG: hypothetical protein Q8R37_04680 [Nanoarchaeota archaeon]|nr:hypothetical protein [Nanoarchaeota archaeon]